MSAPDYKLPPEINPHLWFRNEAMMDETKGKKRRSNVEDPESIGKGRPILAHGFLTQMRETLEVGNTLTEHQRAYLVESIRQIEAGEKPAIALCLEEGRGTASQTLARHKLEIYNKVCELRKHGMTATGAIESTSTTYKVSTSTVRKTYYDFRKKYK